MEPVDLQSLWIHAEPVDLQSLWICGACGSMEPVDLWSLWIHGAQDPWSLGSAEPRIRGASHIGGVDPVLWILWSLYCTACNVDPV